MDAAWAAGYNQLLVQMLDFGCPWRLVKMVRYLALLVVLAIVLGGFVVINAEEHMAPACAKADAAPVTLP